MSDTFIKCSAGVSFIAREVDVVQFGIDATRCGLVPIDNAEEVVSVLQRHPVITSTGDLAQAIAATGIPLLAAEHLVQELLAYGIWRDADLSPSISVWGASPLAYSLAKALERDGFIVKAPVLSVPAREIEENPQDFYKASSTSDPVFLVDLLHLAQTLAADVEGRKATWIPVTSLDTRVLIGPLRRGGKGACMTCFNLHRIEIDPQWYNVISAQFGRCPQLDRQVVNTAVAHTVVLARSLTGVPELPGSTPLRWITGETQEIDLFGRNQQRFLSSHPKCPFCFADESSDYRS